MDDAGEKESHIASTKEGKKTIFGAERFSPKYFRNLGAGVVAAWVAFYGAAHNTLPNDKVNSLSLNPMDTAGKLYSFISEGDCNTNVEIKGPRSRFTERAENLTYGSLRNEASRLGFDLVPANQYIELIDQSRSYKQIIDTLNEYTSSGLGFQTELSHQAQLQLQFPDRVWPGTFIHTSMPDSLFVSLMKQGDEFNNFKSGTKELLVQLQTVPKQLISLSGVKALSIATPVYEFTNGQRVVRLGGADTGSSEIQMTLPSFMGSGSGKVFLHELSHKLDQKICGRWGMERDKQYASRNTFGFVYGNLDSLALSYNAVSQYSLVSVNEDKAEMSAELLGGLDKLWLDSQPDTIKFKAYLTLSRLDNKLPGLSHYLQLVYKYNNPAA